jgi:hypothetical protein
MKHLALFLLLVPTVAVAQPVTPAATPSHWFDNLIVRESLDAKLVPQPAFLTLLLPKDGKNTTAVGVGAQYNLSNASVEWGPTLEYAKNTAADKPQDSLKAGVAADWTTLDIIEHPIGPIIRGKAAFARDGVKGTRGVQLSTSVTPLFRGCGGKRCFSPNVEIVLPGSLLIYSPSAGLEYDDVTRAPAGKPHGSVTRWFWRIGAAVTATGALHDRLELTADYADRHDFSGPRTDGVHDFFQAGLNLFFVRVKTEKQDRAAGVGLAYVNGEDPTKGFQSQAFTRVSFIFRWK